MEAGDGDADSGQPRPVRDELPELSGCGKRTTFIVICPEEGDGCFAAGPGRFMRE